MEKNENEVEECLVHIPPCRRINGLWVWANGVYHATELPQAPGEVRAAPEPEPQPTGFPYALTLDGAFTFASAKPFTITITRTGTVTITFAEPIPTSDPDAATVSFPFCTC